MTAPREKTSPYQRKGDPEKIAGERQDRQWPEKGNDSHEYAKVVGKIEPLVGFENPPHSGGADDQRDRRSKQVKSAQKFLLHPGRYFERGGHQEGGQQAEYNAP